MSFYIKTHTVKNEETLEDIILMYNIPEKEILRCFHNQNAPKDNNHLGYEVFLGQEIFIPSKLDIEKIISDRKTRIVHQQNSLKNQLLKPNLNAIKQHYKVKIKYSPASNPDNFEQLEFDAQIRYLGETTDKLPFLQYRKENYLIDNEISESKLYDLALSSTEFLYPLEFCLHNEIFKPNKITNTKEIKLRWENKKGQLAKMYNDSYSNRYIQTMDEAFEEGFSRYFMNDFFIQFLFAPYMEFVNGQAIAERRFHTYRIAYQDTLEMEILEDFIQVTQSAFCVDPRTAQLILAKYDSNKDLEENNDELIESDIIGNYHLNKKNKTLQKANIKISTLFYDVEESIEVEIDLIP